MKKINKGSTPARLATFIALNPEAKWERKKDDLDESFRCSTARYHEVQQTLRTEQGNLCAYCEIDLISGTNGKLDDCRIEHFHPKSMRENNEPNWALEWDNMFAVCCGGNNNKVVSAETRYEIDPKSHTCDVLKSNKVLDQTIINPLHLSHENCWSFTRSTGEIQPNDIILLKNLIAIEIANQTIKELNLNAKRLRDQRISLINDLNDRIRTYLADGMTIPQAREHLARAILQKSSAGDWPAFFSVIRDILNLQAEKVLEQYNIEDW
jgi:uncharacterized protein (TIGR02646 family)